MSPVTISAEYGPKPDLEVMTDPSDKNSTQIEIPFANGCGDDHMCQPDLFVDVLASKNLTVGEVSTIKVTVRIGNRGEPAYLTQLHIELAPQVELVQLFSKCELKESIVQCLMDNVVEPGTSVNFHLPKPPISRAI